MATPKNRADGIPLVALSGREGKELIYASHDFCDPTTWYCESGRVANKTLTFNAGTGFWESGDPNWINMTDGKVFDEDALVQDQIDENPSDPHGYAVVVTVDGVTKSPKSLLEPSGPGDFDVDYENGQIKPVITENWTGATVVASYSKQVGVGYVLKPTDGRTITIQKAELQFADDISYDDTIVIEIYGQAQYFAPQLVDPNGPLQPTDAIPIETTKYKTIDQMIDEAVGAHPAIPALSSSAPRGYTKQKWIFTFYYATVRKIYSSLGMYVRIGTEHSRKLGGERATATFYCISQSDPGAEDALAALSTST